MNFDSTIEIKIVYFNVSDFCNRVCAPDVLRRKFLDGVHYYFFDDCGDCKQ